MLPERWLVALCLGLGQAQLVYINSDSALATSNPAQSSFGWEMYQMMDALPQLNDTRFIAAASHLSPAVVRVGGISADWVQYVIESVIEKVAPEFQETPIRGSWPLSNKNLTASDFKILLDFCNATGLSLLFDLNELYGRNCNTTNPITKQGDWCVGPWDTSNLHAFLQWIHDNSLAGPDSPLFAFELGNELVSHFDASTNVQDIGVLAAMVLSIWSDVPAEQVPGVYAPSTDNCYDASQLAIIGNISTIPGISGFTYHAYPGGSGVGVNNLTSILTNATWLREGIMTGSMSQNCIDTWNAGPRQTGLQLLITESSSSWNWNFSASVPAQESVLHGFFTIAQNGQYAATGVGILARWSFSGGFPFGTIAYNSSRGAERWEGAADYYHLVLQKRLLGTQVLNVTGPGKSIDALVYGSCGQAGNGSVVLSAVNPSLSPITLTLLSSAGIPLPTTPRTEWIFTAPNGDIGSHNPVLNGNSAAPLRLSADGTPPPLDGMYVPIPPGGSDNTFTLPAMSQVYVMLVNAGAKACGRSWGEVLWSTRVGSYRQKRAVYRRKIKCSA